MDHISNVLDRLPIEQQKTNASPMSNSGLSDRHIVRFFSRMQHLYAHKWASVYGDAMAGGQLTSSARQWLYDLRGYSPEQVASGLAMVEKRAPEWPPGPLEFRRMCDGIPTLEEVLDRRNDYGRVCKEIRSRLDWWNLDSMSSKAMRELADRQYRAAITSLSADGSIARLSAIAAIAARQEPEAIGGGG